MSSINKNMIRGRLNISPIDAVVGILAYDYDPNVGEVVQGVTERRHLLIWIDFIS
jgi:hypothetical protein